MFGALVLSSMSPADGAPLGGLHYLVGSWKCTYRAGSVRLPYDATWAYSRNGRNLQQIDSSSEGDAEELVAYDAHHGWRAVVFDDQGDATIMRAAGNDSNHIAYRSVYPDASIAVTFDRISSTQYTLHGSMRSGGKTITNVDTCLRSAR